MLEWQTYLDVHYVHSNNGATRTDLLAGEKTSKLWILGVPKDIRFLWADFLEEMPARPPEFLIEMLPGQ